MNDADSHHEKAAEEWRRLIREMLAANERREKRLSDMLKVVIHGMNTVTLIVAYTVITVTGHDGTALLYALVAYLGGATVERVTTSKEK